jgi:hypothetical protein
LQEGFGGLNVRDTSNQELKKEERRFMLLYANGEGFKTIFVKGMK